MPSVSIEINGLGGRVAEVTLKSEQTVRDLKRTIEQDKHISAKRQRLIYRDADVNNSFTMDFLSRGLSTYSGAGDCFERANTSGACNATLQMILIKRTDEQVNAITQIGEVDRDELLEYLEDLSEEQGHLLDDADVMTVAIQKNANSMQWASQRLRQDRRFVLSQMALCGYWLEHLDEVLLFDKSFIMSAVGLNGYALRAAGSFKSDRDVVRAALANTGRALEHASPELRADNNIVQFAVKEDGQALQYAASEFKSNKELVLVAVQQDGRALRFADESLRADEEVVSKALGDHPRTPVRAMAVEWVAEPLRSKDYIKKLLSEEDRSHQRSHALFMEIIQNREYEPDSD